MTTLAQVTALVDAHASHDHDRFRAITLQIAAQIAGKSERGAERLRTLVDKARGAVFMPLPQAHGLLAVRSDLASLNDVVLAPDTRACLDRLVLEHARRLDLRAQGLNPARKALFVGPPGTGKTMSAGALARAVGLPLLRVELHAVIGSHLGETSAHLAKVFDHVRTMPGVYLFDEFDALGTDRGSSDGSSAGAEMRRVVNSLLQLIEDDQSDSFIVAATNHARVLDSAIFRRFDETVIFSHPTVLEVAELVRRALCGETASLDPAALCAVVEASGLGHADVCAALAHARKRHLLHGACIDTETVIDRLSARARLLSGGAS